MMLGTLFARRPHLRALGGFALGMTVLAVACDDDKSGPGGLTPKAGVDGGMAADGGAAGEGGTTLPRNTTKVVDSATARPDGKGTFGLGRGVPTIDGDYVVFTTVATSQLYDAIWSYNLKLKTFTKLADTDTPAPGGTGNFTAFNLGTGRSAPLVRDGIVAFVGLDASGGGGKAGIYTVPAAGGALASVVTPATTLPSSGLIDEVPAGDWPFSVGDGKVAFAARSGGIRGIYTADAAGSALVRIVDSSTAFHPATRNLNFFAAPTLEKGTIAFYGQSSTDPTSGPNSLFTCPVGGPVGQLPDGSPNCDEIVTEDTGLLDDGTTPFHTRIHLPFLLDGTNAVFLAEDTNDNATKFHGLYSVAATGGALTKLLTTKDVLPGLDSIDPISIGFSRSDDVTAVVAKDSANHHAYYRLGATKTRLAGAGDAVDGHLVNEAGVLGPRSTANGRVVMLLGSSDGWAGIFVANP